ncbi:MAG: hypothetical protein V7640_1894 [Betaproteobacteria bacterium]|jgi:hypothetical protein
MSKLTLALVAACLSATIAGAQAAQGSPADTDKAGRADPGTSAGQLGASDPKAGAGSSASGSRSGAARSGATSSSGASGTAGTGSDSSSSAAGTGGRSSGASAASSTDEPRVRRTRRGARASKG